MSEGEIRIIRVAHNKENPYFMMNRYAAQDSSLSWEARGVLAYLLSKPDDWRVMVTDLQQNCGRDKVRRVLNELKDAQYLKVVPIRKEDGTYGRAEYQVFEQPYTEKPYTVKPTTDNPLTDNPPLHNTEGQNTERQIAPNGAGEAFSEKILPLEPEDVEEPPTPISAPPPSPVKKGRVDPVFTSITVHLFGLPVENLDSRTRGRMNKMAKISREVFKSRYFPDKDYTPELAQKCANAIEAFCKHYKATRPNMNLPIGEDTFATEFNLFLLSKQGVNSARPVVPAHKPVAVPDDIELTPDEIADIKAQARRATA